jgi:hypothetical protein
MLVGNTATFRLLASGRDAMRDLGLEGDELEAFVVAEDPRGAWIVVEDARSQYPVRLLKWEQFSTARLLPVTRAEKRGRRIGFL